MNIVLDLSIFVLFIYILRSMLILLKYYNRKYTYLQVYFLKLIFNYLKEVRYFNLIKYALIMNFQNIFPIDKHILT